PKNEKLLGQLISLASMKGQIKFSPLVKESIREWLPDMNPKPSHVLLNEYLTRRVIHFMKLCAIVAFAEGELIINTHHYKFTRELFLEMEQLAPKALQYIGSSPALQAINDIHVWIKAEYKKTGKPILEGL